MQTDLYSLLELHIRDLHKARNILVHDSETNGSFILHYCIAAFTKGGFNVCVIGLSQSLLHYASIASKLGVNLTDASNAGRFCFIDGLKLILDNLCSGQETQVMVNPLLRSESHGLKKLFQIIKDKLETLDTSLPTLVVLDDVNSLLFQGIDYHAIADFLHYFMQLSSITTRAITTVSLIHSDDSVEDEEANYLKASCSLYSDVLVGVRGLETGYCKDVHGEVEVVWTKTFRDPIYRKQPQLMQYKINDRGVAVFARGTSSAVL